MTCSCCTLLPFSRATLPSLERSTAVVRTFSHRAPAVTSYVSGSRPQHYWQVGMVARKDENDLRKCSHGDARGSCVIVSARSRRIEIHARRILDRQEKTQQSDCSVKAWILRSGRASRVSFSCTYVEAPIHRIGHFSYSCTVCVVGRGWQFVRAMRAEKRCTVGTVREPTSDCEPVTSRAEP